MSAVTSVVHHGVRGSSAVGTAQEISGLNPIQPGGQGRDGGALESLIAKACRILCALEYQSAVSVLVCVLVLTFVCMHACMYV